MSECRYGYSMNRQLIWLVISLCSCINGLKYLCEARHVGFSVILIRARFGFYILAIGVW